MSLPPVSEGEAPRERTSTATPTVTQIIEFAVGKLVLAPGEILLVRGPDDLQAQDVAFLQDMLKAMLTDYGYDNDVIVSPQAFEFTVVSPDG